MIKIIIQCFRIDYEGGGGGGGGGGVGGVEASLLYTFLRLHHTSISFEILKKFTSFKKFKW